MRCSLWKRVLVSKGSVVLYFPMVTPLVVPVVALKAGFVSCVWVNKNRMPSRERIEGISLVPKTDTSVYRTCARCEAPDTNSITVNSIKRGG